MTDKRKPDGGKSLPDMHRKAASLSPQVVSDDELKLINKYALEPLTAEEVYTFKAVLCDNELDRDYEQFNVKSLKELQKLFVGKTVIKDHFHSADNQVARIYATELVETGKTVKSTGEPYMQLVAHCYMIKTASNADLIAEIKGGIKKEGSVGFRASSAICSICQTDNAKTYCRHWPGRSYAKEGGETVCTFTLAGVSDAYEFSLVAVPAQRAAGVSKSYTGETVYEKDEAPVEDTPDNTDEKAAEITLRARIAETRAKFHTDND